MRLSRSFLCCVSIYLLVLIIQCAQRGLSDSPGASYVSESLRPAFEKDFYNKCSIYPFFDTYKRNLQQPISNKSIIYIFQEETLDNGGLGDRLAGIVTAMSIALRFNRSLIIHSRNGLEKLFQPFNPDEKSSKKTYLNRFSSEDLRSVKRQGEYTAGNCVNAEAGGPAHLSACSMDKGDVHHETVTLRCNRAFLCQLALRNSPAYGDIKRILRRARYSNISSISSSSRGGGSDLFRAAGCMLRLALWPTEKMWKLVGTAYEEVVKARESVRTSSTVDTIEAVGGISGGVSEVRERKNKKKLWKYQIGLHFRCGDHSFVHRNSSTTGNRNIIITSDNMCLPNRGSIADVTSCANKVIKNFTTTADASNEVRNGFSDDKDGDVLTYITSDNIGLFKHQRNVINSKNIFLSPPGCHVNFNRSDACTEATFVYWMVLALSDMIVSQGFSDGSTTSGFYLYAKIYGLKENNWRNANGDQCTRHSEYSDVLLSHRRQGNWWC